MSSLKALQPASIAGLTLRNRLIVPPMVTYLGNPKGFMTPELVAYARARAKGGFGLFTLEATYVDRSGCGFCNGLGLDNDDKIEGMRILTDAVHAEGGKIPVQL
ncbi:MAG: NADH:flavin oxidoreductase, partial [Mailhella sp.]